MKHFVPWVISPASHCISDSHFPNSYSLFIFYVRIPVYVCAVGVSCVYVCVNMCGCSSMCSFLHVQRSVHSIFLCSYWMAVYLLQGNIYSLFLVSLGCLGLSGCLVLGHLQNLLHHQPKSIAPPPSPSVFPSDSFLSSNKTTLESYFLKPSHYMWCG